METADDASTINVNVCLLKPDHNTTLNSDLIVALNYTTVTLQPSQLFC